MIKKHHLIIFIMVCVSNPYILYAKLNQKKKPSDDYKQIIIVPPVELYTTGYKLGLDKEQCIDHKKRKNEKCKKYLACEENEKNPSKELFSKLGREIHFAMEKSLGIFNNHRKSKQKCLFYTKLSLVNPCCEHNPHIIKFYDSVNKKGFLSKQLLKKKCDVMVWAQYDKRFHKVIENHIGDPEKKECDIQVKICFFDGDAIKTQSVKLTYNDNFRTFTDKSKRSISLSIFELLKQKHSLQNKKSKKISNK